MSKPASLLLIISLSITLASAQTTVKGTVTGADGRPMPMANIFLSQPEDTRPIRSVEAAKDGKFTITIDSTGIWILQFTGVGHRDHRVALYLDNPQTIRVDIRLGTYRYLTDFSQAKIVGDFNRWYVLSAVPLQRQPDGTYAAQVEATADTVAYRLNGVRDGDAVEGTMADRYASNGSGGYISIVDAKNRKARISLDPRKLIRSNEWARMRFADASATISGFATIYDDLQHLQDRYLKAFRDSLRSGGGRREFKYDWSATLSSLQKQIKGETNAVLRKGIALNYLTIAMIAKQAESSICRTALDVISPTSMVWSLNSHSLYFALAHSDLAENQREEYIQRVLDKNPVVSTKAALLFDEFMAATLSDQKENADKFYDLLTNRYPNTPEGTLIRERYPRKDNLRLGKPIPSFSVVSMDNPKKTISNVSLRGKYILMEFWAAKNDSSVREMEALQKAYEKYRKANFVILSLSLDDSLKHVVEFRRGKWRMPWLNAFLGREIQNKVVKDFQVVDVPQAFLVGPKGNLMAMGKELLGENLAKTLTKHLEK